MFDAAPAVAYFSMEVALADDIPTYSGGLGVLAGDTLRAAADIGLDMVGVTLLYRRGYLRQSFDEAGNQIALPVEWRPEDKLERVDVRVEVELGERTVALGAWRHVIEGASGRVTVYLLDADVDGNAADDRRLTDALYGGDASYRLAQEIVLGIGGRRLLVALGLGARVHHLNEGHAALLALELLHEARRAGNATIERGVDQVRRACVFTTHTPVPAGHDRFPSALVDALLDRTHRALLAELPGLSTSELHMTELALALSGFVNGVAERHAEVSREMFPGRPIHAVTNGVHSATWSAPPMRELFDRHLPAWRREGAVLRAAQAIPADEIVRAHAQSKRALLGEVAQGGFTGFDERTFTIGFARRATAYKRATLLFTDPKRLRRIAARWGGLQVIFAGKAHPRDLGGIDLIRTVIGCAARMLPEVRVAYLPDYGMRLGALVTAGVDVWLNNPRAPLEASGTSGMKAAHNGVPNLSVRDGWWCEGAIEGVTGWTIEPHDHRAELGALEAALRRMPGRGPTAAQAAARALAREQARLEHEDDLADAARLYELLDGAVLPTFHRRPAAWAEVMRGAIAHGASYFNAQRMLEQYVRSAYAAAAPAPGASALRRTG
jgi:starch phosphorylase